MTFSFLKLSLILTAYDSGRHPGVSGPGDSIPPAGAYRRSMNARRSPSAIRMLPVNQRILSVHAFLRDSHGPKPPEKYPRKTRKMMPNKAKKSPRHTIWTEAFLPAGSTNCGRNARKNRATLGFSTLDRIPWTKIVRAPAFDLSVSKAKSDLLWKAFSPRYIRYPAPANFTARNARADVLKMTARPKAARRDAQGV